jgi:hypothetical protein
MCHHIVLMALVIYFFSSTSLSIFSLVRCSIQLTITILSYTTFQSFRVFVILSYLISIFCNHRVPHSTFIKRFFILIFMLLEHNNFCFFINADFAYAINIMFETKIFLMNKIHHDCSIIDRFTMILINILYTSVSQTHL